MPKPWPLYFALSLLVIVQVSHAVVSWVSSDLANPNVSRAHFYSQEAWRNCGAMDAAAKAQGAMHWTCHDPNR